MGGGRGVGRVSKQPDYARLKVLSLTALVECVCLNLKAAASKQSKAKQRSCSQKTPHLAPKSFSPIERNTKRNACKMAERTTVT